MSDKKPIVLVDRSKWCCGRRAWSYTESHVREYNTSRLLQTPENGGGLCCLGFAMRDRGYTDAQLLDKPTPVDVDSDNPFIHKTLPHRTYNTTWTENAMVINDDDELPDGERENRLTELCKNDDAPLKFVFIGEYPK